MTDHELQLKAVRLRMLTLEAIYEAGAGHTGGDFGRGVWQLFWMESFSA
jgi:hypothetical protein